MGRACAVGRGWSVDEARKRNGGRGAAYDRLSPGERERLLGCRLILAIAAPFLALACLVILGVRL